MILAISGTPGTGKTSVAEALIRKLNATVKKRTGKYRLVKLNSLAKKAKAQVGYDSRRHSTIIGITRLRAALKELTGRHANIVMEGHFAHLLPADLVVILRCDPMALEKRLKEKYDWPTKVTENAEAELMGVITDEALPMHKVGTVFEVDTTKRTAEETADILRRIVEGDERTRLENAVGRIDWMRGV
ncbi:MAG: adenylate kinase family protein [Candidatus Aenigmatarchaeota archaeon]